MRKFSFYRLLAAGILAVAVPFIAVPVASADTPPLEIKQFSVTPSDMRAGAHADLQVQVTFSGYPSDRPRTVTLHLPNGLIGNHANMDQCPVSKFNSDSCPASSHIGTVSSKATAKTFFGPIGTSADGEIFNLERAGEGDVGRLGIVVRPPLSFLTGKMYLIARMVMRPSSSLIDGGMDAVLTDLPTKMGGSDFWINSMNLKFEGTPKRATGPYITNPTKCVPAMTTIEVLPYEDSQIVSAQDSFTPVGCLELPPPVG